MPHCAKKPGLKGFAYLIGDFRMRSIWLGLAFSSALAFASSDEQTALRRYQQLSEKAPELHAGLLAPERTKLFKEVRNHPVTDLDNLGGYDPDGFVGFCFGRSMGVHLMARRMGVASASLHKLFIIGDLRSGTDPEWRFHVTGVVLGEGGEWYAIDPIMVSPIAPGTPLKLAEWVRIVRGIWDKKHKARLYFTSPDTVMPDVTKDFHGTTGNAILEDIFDPAKKTGFTPDRVSGVDVWRTDTKSEAAYFISVKEPESDRFKFDGLDLAGQFVDYRGYFTKLVGDLSGEAPIPPPVQAVAAGPVPESVPRRKPSLKSFRLDRFFP